MQGSDRHNDDKVRVLQSTDIVRLVGDHVAVKKKGKEFVCLCPFHDDHNPSMSVSPQKQIFKCWVCGAGGDAISFVMDYHRMGFGEALRFLADRAGIQLTPWKPTRREGGDDDAPDVTREDLRTANRVAADFYRVLLKHSEHGTAARAVIEKRGVSPEMVERFALGASPDMWDGLVRLINSKSLAEAPYLGAGLIRRRENSPGSYDMLRHRLIFPIHDQSGAVIGFGGRKLREEDEPKYLNSPETALFNKSETLYGIHQAGETIRKTGRAVVVEGYMDVIACHQAGLTSAVAALGTALTTQGALRLARQCDSVVLLFDGDDAGQRAADRAVEVFFSSPLDVKIATLSAARARGEIDAKDPDELLKQPGGLEKLQRILDQATEALEYRLSRLRDRMRTMSATGRSQLVEEELKRLAELGLSRISPIRRDMVLKQIAQALGVSESVVRGAAPFGRDGRPGGAQVPRPEAAIKVSLQSPFAMLLACAVSDPSLVSSLAEADRALLSPNRFEDEATKTVAAALESLMGTGQPLTLAWVMSSLSDRGVQAVGAALVAEIDRVTGCDSKRLRTNWDDCVLTARARFARSAASGDLDQLRLVRIGVTGVPAASVVPPVR
ncbi:MAG: DNA primase [Phycisphaerales bacterium]